MKTVLLIEDDAAIRENTCELLELKGFQVISAVNGKEGLALAEENKPDIILCDIMMPEADGYQVFTELKNNNETSSIPFIFLTASVEKKEVEKAFGMGVHGYIRKPFDTDELFNAIENCLNKK
ncbi:MAG TPA: response regulator [Bacteroidia bacterium]|nr:response regulator [Bacteroidia bacterium]